MNDFKGFLNKKKSDEPPEKLQKVFKEMLTSFYHLEKCMDFSKEYLAECSNKLDEMRSQLVALGSIVEETSTNNQQQFSNLNKSGIGRNTVKKISDPDIIEEITIEGSEKSNDSRNIAGSKSNENRRKKQRTSTKDDEIYVITQESNDECTPGPSRQAARTVTPLSGLFRREQPINDKRTSDTKETLCTEDVVETALRKTKGVLSAQDLNTFLHLSENVEDPVQLAKVSFTKDIKLLYFQIMTFHFYLKVANDAAEKEKGSSSTNRDLENKVQQLIHKFQTEI